MRCGYRFAGLGFRLRVLHLGLGFGIRALDLGFRVCDFAFRIRSGGWLHEGKQGKASNTRTFANPTARIKTL